MAGNSVSSLQILVSSLQELFFLGTIHVFRLFLLWVFFFMNFFFLGKVRPPGVVYYPSQPLSSPKNQFWGGCTPLKIDSLGLVSVPMGSRGPKMNIPVITPQKLLRRPPQNDLNLFLPLVPLNIPRLLHTHYIPRFFLHEGVREGPLTIG